MSKAPPFLSILIPTFNRRDDLLRLIKNIESEIVSIPDVEIVISDNSSTDGTYEALEPYREKAGFHIHSHPINYGMSINFAWIYGQARGKYLWMIGDDDVLHPGTIKKVVNALKDDPALVWIHLPHRLVRRGQPDVESWRPESRLTVQAQEIIPRAITWIAFISANIIRTKDLHDELRNSPLSSLFWPMSLLIKTAANKRSLVFDEVSVIGGPDVTWKDQLRYLTAVGFPSEILSCSVLPRSVMADCLKQRYCDAPEWFDLLLRIDPVLCLKVVYLCPSLLTPSWFYRQAKRAAKKLFGKRLPIPATNQCLDKGTVATQPPSHDP